MTIKYKLNGVEIAISRKSFSLILQFNRYIDLLEKDQDNIALYLDRIIKFFQKMQEFYNLKSNYFLGKYNNLEALQRFDICFDMQYIAIMQVNLRTFTTIINTAYAPAPDDFDINTTQLVQIPAPAMIQ